jgi:hypothetical protein
VAFTISISEPDSDNVDRDGFTHAAGPFWGRPAQGQTKREKQDFLNYALQLRG